MPITGEDIQTAIQLFLEDFSGSFDEKSQIYVYRSFRETKSQLMENDIFQGYFSAIIGSPTPDDYLEGLKQQKPKLCMRKADEPLGKRYEIPGLENSGFAEALYEVKAENFRTGWDKGILRKGKINAQMQKSPDEHNYLS